MGSQAKARSHASIGGIEPKTDASDAEAARAERDSRPSLRLKALAWEAIHPYLRDDAVEAAALVPEPLLPCAQRPAGGGREGGREEHQWQRRRRRRPRDLSVGDQSAGERWTPHPGFPGSEQKEAHLKFSAVLGTTSPKRPIVMLQTAQAAQTGGMFRRRARGKKKRDGVRNKIDRSEQMRPRRRRQSPRGTSPLPPEGSALPTRPPAHARTGRPSPRRPRCRRTPSS